MREAAQTVRILRFGVFELDLASGELRRQGAKVKLQEQPFQVLAILAEHAGEVVAREELRRRLWPEDTFVDFEHGLATAINKGREALGDTAQSPRFIETLPKRGYRFIAPVELLPPGSSFQPRGAEGEAKSGAIAEAVYRSPEQAKRTGTRSLRPWHYAVGSALIVVVGMLFTFNIAGLRGRLLTLSKPADGVPLSEIRSIAVLPLENLSRDPDQEYFSDGMTDELIATLAKVQSLRIISRASVERYKGTKKSTPQIARELGVDAVLEGTVLHSGGRLRITAELVGSTDRNLWADSFESDERDVLILQDELAREIAGEIQVKLQPAERANLTGAGPIDPEAHDAYLKALFFYYGETRDSLPKAIQYVQQALQLDPNYADAFALLAACDYDTSRSRWGNVPNQLAAQRTKETASKALELNASLAEPHVALGAVAEGHDWDWATAESEFQKAIELDPSLVSAHVGLSWHYIFMGRRDAAIQEMNRAVELDPVSDYTLEHQVFILFYSRQYDQAILQASRALDLFPEDSTLYYLRGRAYEAKGMYDEAVSSWQQELSHDGQKPSVVAALGSAFEAGGIKAVYRWQLDRLTKPGAGQPYQVAEYYIALGEKDKAIEWIEKEYPRRGQGMLFVQIDPRFDSLRADPRYQRIMDRMKFPQ